MVGVYGCLERQEMVLDGEATAVEGCDFVCWWRWSFGEDILDGYNLTDCLEGGHNFFW